MKNIILSLLFISSIYASNTENNQLLNSLRELENQHLENLLAKKITLKPINGKSLLNLIQINFNFYSKVKLLLDANIDLNYIDKDGNSIIQNYQNLIKRYKKLYKRIKSNTIKEIQIFSDVPQLYKKILLEKNGKKVVLRSINYQQHLLKKAIKLIKYKKEEK